MITQRNYSATAIADPTPILADDPLRNRTIALQNLVQQITEEIRSFEEDDNMAGARGLRLAQMDFQIQLDQLQLRGLDALTPFESKVSDQAILDAVRSVGINPFSLAISLSHFSSAGSNPFGAAISLNPFSLTGQADRIVDGYYPAGERKMALECILQHCEEEITFFEDDDNFAGAEGLRIYRGLMRAELADLERGVTRECGELGELGTEADLLAVIRSLGLYAQSVGVRLSKEEAERLVRAGFESVMCAEYGEDSDWVGVTRDDLINEDGEADLVAGCFDDDYLTFEIWV